MTCRKTKPYLPFALLFFAIAGTIFWTAVFVSSISDADAVCESGELLGCFLFLRQERRWFVLTHVGRAHAED
jgi:hypothetical protein